VFLGQNVVSNFELDYNMMQKLGELYPRQHVTLPDSYFSNDKDLLDIYEAFLKGMDLFTHEYLNTWKLRLNRLLSWLNKLTNDLIKEDPTFLELYEAAVRSINEQPLAPYYIVSSYYFEVKIFIKVNKEQYIKILEFFIKFIRVFKKADFYADILNLEIIPSGVIEDTEDENFHLVFPQVFPAFSLADWDPIKDFYISFYTIKIRRVYISKLWVKYYNYLETETSFFQNFSHLKVLASTETAMLIYLNTLNYNYINYQHGPNFWLFLSNFMDYLEPFFIPYAKRKY
jgi:hypothetical protein